MSPRNVNVYRNLIAAIFNHGVRRGVGRFKLAANPATGIEQRREPKPAPLIYFTPEEVEAAARALGAGAHRTAPTGELSADEVERRYQDDLQDAEAVRLAAYTGLRRGELIALRWSDMDWAGADTVTDGRLSEGLSAWDEDVHE